jgi:hypothetical protein
MTGSLQQRLRRAGCCRDTVAVHSLMVALALGVRAAALAGSVWRLDFFTARDACGHRCFYKNYLCRIGSGLADGLA